MRMELGEKACPFCGEAIQAAAVVCRFCRFDLRTGGPLPDRTLEVASREVIVTDVSMSFTSMIGFMVKWAIAAIPALVILWVIAMTVFALLAAFFGIPRQRIFSI